MPHPRREDRGGAYSLSLWERAGVRVRPFETAAPMKHGLDEILRLLRSLGMTRRRGGEDGAPAMIGGNVGPAAGRRIPGCWCRAHSPARGQNELTGYQTGSILLSMKVARVVRRGACAIAERVRPALSAGFAFLVAASAARAQYPAIEFTPPPCVPAQGNTLVEATITPAEGWSSIRTYFMRDGRTEAYFVEMRGVENNKFWTVLPKPDEDTVAVSVQIAVRDDQGRETRSPARTVPVVKECRVDLTQDQLALSRNLVVGETLAGQYGGGVLGFLCEGIVLRMNYRGDLRPEDCCCEAAMLVYAKDKKLLLPLVILGGVGAGTVISGGGGGEVSASRP